MARLSVINCSFHFVVLLSLVRLFVVEFIERYKWFGLFSTVHSCLFLRCATDIYVLCLCLALWNSALFYATILIILVQLRSRSTAASRPEPASNKLTQIPFIVWPIGYDSVAHKLFQLFKIPADGRILRLNSHNPTWRDEAVLSCLEHQRRIN